MSKNLEDVYAQEVTEVNPALEALKPQASSVKYDQDKQEIDLAAVTSNPIGIGEIADQLTSGEKYYALKRYNLDVVEDWDDLPVTAFFMLEQLQKMEEEDAIEILKEAIPRHDHDLNFPHGLCDRYREIVTKWEAVKNSKNVVSSDPHKTDKDKGVSIKEDMVSVKVSPRDDENVLEVENWEFEARLEALLIAHWSPYPEVRSVSDPFDDPKQRCETFRAYAISVVWQGIGTFINTYFKARQPPISLASEVVQIFIYPCGLLWAQVVPNWTLKFWKGFQIELNPGPWTAKEQMFATLIYVVAGLSNSSYNALFIQKSKVFFFTDWAGWGYEILLSLSLSCLGLGLAGLLRCFFVYPYEQIWPFIIPTNAVNKALMSTEKNEKVNGWKITRYKFFFAVFILSFLYFWIPDYLFQALLQFSWLTWIKPNNLHLDNLCGFNGGIGINPIPTFDFNVMWAQIQPLVNPAYAILQAIFGVVILAFSSLGIYYSNYKWAAFLPLNSNTLFDNKGEPYNASMILNADKSFDSASFKEYSLPFYSAWNLVSTGAGYAVIPFLFCYTILENWRALLVGFRVLKNTLCNRKGSSMQNFKDPFCRMNSHYKEAPEWWFLVVILVSLALAIGCVRGYPTGTPVWSLFFALAYSLVTLFPVIQCLATTGSLIVLQGLVGLVAGYTVKGQLLAYVLLTLYGDYIPEQCQNYLSNQKIAHYAKVPPRAMFRGQLFTTIINAFITIAIVNWEVSLPDVCTPKQSAKFTCQNVRTSFNQAVVWGLIGPKIIFEELYPILKWCFLIGFLLVFPCIAFKWYGPRKITRSFSPSMILYGLTMAPPYNLSYYIPSIYWAVGFMWYLKTRYTAWWQKYNFLFYSAITAGIAFSAIIIFFSVQYHPKDLSWWGNNVILEGLDGQGGAPLNNATFEPEGYFGPRIGSFD